MEDEEEEEVEHRIKYSDNANIYDDNKSEDNNYENKYEVNEIFIDYDSVHEYEVDSDINEM